VGCGWGGGLWSGERGEGGGELDKERGVAAWVGDSEDGGWRRTGGRDEGKLVKQRVGERRRLPTARA
jgi:hypothetical protein